MSSQNETYRAGPSEELLRATQELSIHTPLAVLHYLMEQRFSVENLNEVMSQHEASGGSAYGEQDPQRMRETLDAWRRLALDAPERKVLRSQLRVLARNVASLGLEQKRQSHMTRAEQMQANQKLTEAAKQVTIGKVIGWLSNGYEGFNISQGWIDYFTRLLGVDGEY